MDLSIIIVNWNSSDYTLACLDSIRATTRNLEYEIIVVDNASTNDSVEKLKTAPDIRLLAAPTNLGFARANNLGYRHSSGDVLLFLNPDTRVEEAAICQMREALLSSDRLGIVGCRLLNSDYSLQTSCVQAFPTILNQFTDVEALKVRFPAVPIWGILPLFKPETRLAPVEVVSGACLMIRRKVFENVGLFSSNYFMYCEDIDLCHKVAAAGFEVGYVADAAVIHFGGQSSKQARDSSFANVVTREAMYTFFAKTKSSTYARAYSCSMGVAAASRLLLLSLCPPSLFGIDHNNSDMTRRKWKRILRWSLGRERWARQLGFSTGETSRSTQLDVAQ